MTSAERDLTVIVNTSDGFSDCWAPFFDLMSVYWPDCPYRIHLNTETIDYAHPAFDIVATRVGEGAPRRLTWSECLAACLGQVATPYVLYLQEDYFLEAPVRADLIETFLGAMRDGRADVIRLMECDGSGPWHATDDPLLWEVDQYARYRIALQAALWRKSTLQAALRAHETAWQLEGFGSARARRNRRDKVMCAARDRFHGEGREIFPYQPTGVVNGKWERTIVEPLFAKHGFHIDFERRGFFDPSVKGKRAPLLKRLSDRSRSWL